MAVFPASGRHRCISGEKSFLIQLGTGTSVTVSINGKMNGILAGFPVTGFGMLEYTYIKGASEWVRSDFDGSAIGPSVIPVTLANTVALVYDPTGRCSAKVSIETTSDVAPESVGFKFKNKKQVWKMKGRTDILTINVVQDAGGACALDDVVIGGQCAAILALNPPNYEAAINTFCNTTHPACGLQVCADTVFFVCPG